MKRSEMETRRLLDGVESKENSRTAAINFLDEFNVAPRTNEDITNIIANALYIAPVFLPAPMWIGSVMVGLNTAAGTVSYRLALYKAIRTQRASRDHKPTDTGGGILLSLFLDGSVEWSRVAMGPETSHTTGNLGRYLWMLDREFIARPPDIYGVGYMASSANGVFKGGVNDLVTHTALRCIPARSNMGDFPDTLATVQGAASAMPAFVLRSPRALTWIGG